MVLMLVSLTLVLAAVLLRSALLNPQPPIRVNLQRRIVAIGALPAPPPCRCAPASSITPTSPDACGRPRFCRGGGGGAGLRLRRRMVPIRADKVDRLRTTIEKWLLVMRYTPKNPNR